MSIEVRAARAGDGAFLHAMVHELAVHHGYEKYFEAVPGDFERMIADPRAISGALLAFCDGEPAGAAVWHRAFSTFRGRETLYLEDLSVLPKFRKRGVGTALLKGVARVARSRKVRDMHWLMMAWNEEARRFYERLGARIEDGNCLCMVSGEALERLGA